MQRERTSIRLPSHLYQSIKDAAKRNGNTAHGEMVSRLAASFKAEKINTSIETPWGRKVQIRCGN